MFEEGQIGIYIHWPFCLSKCPYCDFNVYLKNNFDDQSWLDAYLKSIRHYAHLMPDREVVSIYFGGGTPSLMKPNEVNAIIDEIKTHWSVFKNLEITLEANPTSTEIDKFESFRESGVNRLSLGVQSLNDDELKFLGRLHSSDEVFRAIEVADSVFERFTFDLIYALPQQTLEKWEYSLKNALPYMKGHLSAYQLTIKQGTAFEKQVARNHFMLPDQERAADFYLLTNKIMAEHNMPAYEISNYGAHGHESLHNMIYWHYQDYIGIGPGAHGRISIDGRKYANQDYKKPKDWINATEENGYGAKPYEELSKNDQFEEMMMAGLRLSSGIDQNIIETKTGVDMDACIDWNKVQILADQEWLTIENRKLIPTIEGWLRADSILPYILKQ